MEIERQPDSEGMENSTLIQVDHISCNKYEGNLGKLNAPTSSEDQRADEFVNIASFHKVNIVGDNGQLVTRISFAGDDDNNSENQNVQNHVLKSIDINDQLAIFDIICEKYDEEIDEINHITSIVDNFISNIIGNKNEQIVLGTESFVAPADNFCVNVPSGHSTEVIGETFADSKTSSNVITIDAYPDRVCEISDRTLNDEIENFAHLISEDCRKSLNLYVENNSDVNFKDTIHSVITRPIEKSGEFNFDGSLSNKNVEDFNKDILVLNESVLASECDLSSSKENNYLNKKIPNKFIVAPDPEENLITNVEASLPTAVDYKSQKEVTTTNIIVNLPTKVNENLSELRLTQIDSDKNILENDAQTTLSKETTKIDEKINFVTEINRNKGFWKCADPTCKSLNASDSKICEKCSLSNMFSYEKIGKFGKARTIVKNKNMDHLYNKKWLVVHSIDNKVFLRDPQMQLDFGKFLECLNQFLKENPNQEMTTLNSSCKPAKGEAYILTSESVPFRVIFEDEVIDVKPKAQCLDVAVKNQWKVYYKDVGKSAVVNYCDLVKITSSSIIEQKTMVRQCILDNISFKNFHHGRRTEIDAWIKEQLVNKFFNVQVKDSKSKYGRTKLSYVDILLEDAYQNFRNKFYCCFGGPSASENKNVASASCYASGFSQTMPSSLDNHSFSMQSKDNHHRSQRGGNKNVTSASCYASGFSHTMPSSLDNHSFSMQSEDDHHRSQRGGYESRPQNQDTINSYPMSGYGTNWNTSYSPYVSGYYDNRLASSSLVPSTAYNPMNNNFSIIPILSSNSSASGSSFKPSDIEDNARRVSILEGELKAYKEEIKRQGKGTYTDNLHKLYTQITNIVTKRADINHFMNSDSPLSRAVSMLLKDATLVSHLEDAAIKGKEIRESCTRNDVNINQVLKFKEILNPLKLPDKLKSLEHLIPKLDELRSMLYIASGVKSCVEIGFEFSFEVMCGEYNNKKKLYFENMAKTENAVSNFQRSLDNFNDWIRNMFKGVFKIEFTKANFLELKDSIDVITAEEQFTTEMKNSGVIDRILGSVLEEMTKRRMKIREVEEERKYIESISLESKETFEPPFNIERDEDNLGTLLDFVRTSKKMSQNFKYMVVEDIFKELLKNHQKNKMYFYVNPANILINSGAALCSDSNLTLREPIPPFQFLAPECYSLQPDILTLYRGREYAYFHIEDSALGPAADCYSLGQLIQWIFCADAPINEFPKQLSVVESQPLMRKLLDPSPNERPSLEELNEKGLFKELLTNIFGEYNVPERDIQDIKSEDADVIDVAASSFVTSPAEAVEKNFAKSLPIVEKKICPNSTAFENPNFLSSPSESTEINSSNLLRITPDISPLSQEKVDVVKNDEDDIFMEMSDPSITDELALLCSEENSIEETLNSDQG